jgi:hypothetical protein
MKKSKCFINRIKNSVISIRDVSFCAALKFGTFKGQYKWDTLENVKARQQIERNINSL